MAGMHRPPTSVCATLVNWQMAMSAPMTAARIVEEVEIVSTPMEAVLNVSTTCTLHNDIQYNARKIDDEIIIIILKKT